MAVVAELEAIITADSSGFDAAVDAAGQKLNELGKSSGQTADQFNAAGGMMAAAGAAMLAPIVGATMAAADFEFAMDGVNASLGGVDTATLDLLEAQALELGASSKFSATEIASVQEQLAKTGLSAEDLLDGATKAVIDLAAATGEGLPQSASAAASAMHAFGLEGEDMSRVADIITGTLNNSSTSLAGYEMGINNLGPVLSNMNKYQQMTAEGLNGAEEAFIDTSAAVGYFNQQGMKAADAGLSLARGITFLSKPTKKAAALIEELGIEAFDLNGNFKSIPDLMDELNESMSGMSDQAREAALSTIFGAEAADVMNKAIKRGGDPLREFTELLREEGIAAEQAELRQDNLTSKVEQLGGALNGLAIQMGTPLLDPITKATEGITGIVNALAGAPEPVQKLVSEFAALTGGLLTFGGLAALGTGKVLELGQTFSKAGLSLPKFAAGLGLVGLAIGAGLLAYETNFLGFRDTVDKAMEGAGKAIETFGNEFDTAFNTNKAAGLNDVAAAIGALGVAVDNTFGTDYFENFKKAALAAQKFGDSWQAGVAMGVDPWVNALMSASRAAEEFGATDLANNLNTMGRAWEAMHQKMAETEGTMPELNRQLSALQEGLGVIAEEAGWVADAQDVPNFFDDLGMAAATAQDDLTDLKNALGAGDWSEVGQILMRDAPNIESFFNNLGDGITTLQEGFETFDLGDAAQGMSDQIQTWFMDMGRHLFGGMDSMAGPGERNVEGAFSQLANDIGIGFAGMGDSITQSLAGAPNPFEGVTQWLQEGMDEVTRFFQPQEMAAGLGGAGMGDTSGISQMFSGVVDGISAGMDQAVTDLGALAEEKKTGFKNALGDLFGPLGQFLFPSEDALASEDSMFGDPAKMGEQFGKSLLNTFTDPAFEESLRTSIDAMPDEAFQATGTALLGAIGDGMKTALTQPVEGPDGTTTGQTMGQQMAGTLATGLSEGFLTVPPETFVPAASGMIGQLNNALGVAMADASSQFVDPSGVAGGLPVKGGGMGQQMVQSLATGLTDSITNAPVETFLPASSALGTKLGEAMSAVSEGVTPPSGLSESTQQAPGFGAQMVQGLATGLTDSITAAPAEMFVPVTGALGAKLGEAMSLAAQPVQPAGGVGPVDPASGVGTSMVQGLATGLTDSITAAPVETFYPVANALGKQMGTALETALTQTVGIGEGGGGLGAGEESAGGVGKQMVAGLATGLQQSIADTPVETFQPVGAALGNKLGEALSTAMSAPMPKPGADGGATTNIGAGMVEGLATSLTDSITSAPTETFAPVGTALGTKLGEALQTVAEGGGEFDVSEQVGTSVGQMLQTGIEQADFTGVGDQLTSQLSDQLTSAIDELSSQVEETMGQLTESISEAVNQMGEAIGEATEQVSQAVEEMASGIEEAVSAVSDAVAEMAASVEEAAGQMEEAAQGAVDAASEIGSAAEEAASAVESAMQSMAAAVQAAAGAIEGAAGQIIAALNSIAGAAAAAGAAIGSALAGGFSDSLGISSPSTVFVGFGKNIVEGLAKGMGGNVSILSKGSTSLAKQSMSTLANAIGMGSPATKFMPHGAAITQGMMAGMLQEAKGRIQSAMGQMAGAVESGMGKVKSAVASGMERVRSQGQQQATQMGADTATAAATGMTSEERQAERAARRLWKRAYRELMNGVGAARFLGEAWAREFWTGMLDSGGSLEFAQYVTQQVVGAAENAVTAAAGAVAGLGTQLEIVAGTISTLTSDLESLEAELAGIGQQEQQQRLQDARDELSLQQQITRELEARFKTQFSEAHQAHIRAMQTGSASAQADYEHKLRVAQATDTAIAESKIREGELSSTLDAMIQAMADATREELALRKAAVLEEIALKKAQLAQEEALQTSLTAAQQAAQMDYTTAVISGSQDRIRQLEKELRKASGPEQKKTIQAQIQLEQQRIATAQQLAVALQAQAGISDTTSAAYAQAAAQVSFLTGQIEALGEVDVASLLSSIVSDLGAAASTMSTAASDMSAAATDMGSMEAAAPVQAATKAAAEFGTEAAVAERGMFSMANAYDAAMLKMREDGQKFQEQFQGMVANTTTDGATGGAAIGDALTTGITGRIQEGGKATQTAMLQHLQGAVDETTGEAIKGGDTIATEFGASMRGQMGTELSQVHQQVLGGMTKAVNDTAQEAAQGGKDVAGAYGQSSTDKLKDEIPKFQTAMNNGMNGAVRDAKTIASRGGREIGSDLGSGVQAGLQGATQGIANQAAQTVKDAIQAAKDAAKANSPSRRMMDLGDDMGLGLVLGLRGRHGDAEDASARLVHIPMSPTSSGGVSGRRAYEERHGGGTTITIEHLELPGVNDPEQFIAAMERLASANGVASGRR